MKSKTSERLQPIFIHSLWRSSSTYFFNKFRTSKGYFAYQEPLHEVVLNAVGNPNILNNLSAEVVGALRHPDMPQGHFHELFLTYPAWKDHILRDSIYRRYFAQQADADLNAFFDSLIDAAPSRPVIQECRTSLRIRPIKENFGGLHMALVRNPWDQWWSFKTVSYFEAVLQLLLQSDNLPPVLQQTRELIAFREFRSTSLDDEIVHFIRNPLDHKASYRIFFTLWCLAWLHARDNADLLINVDAFSASPSYRRDTIGALSHFGVEGLNFDDCKSFLAPFTPSGSVFSEIEQSVLHQIRLDSAPASDLAELEEALEQFTALRAEHLKERDTNVALEALDRRQQTVFLLQDSEHQLAVFYTGELERANVVAEGIRQELLEQQHAATTREAQLLEESAAAFARVDHLEMQLQEQRDHISGLIEEHRKQAAVDVVERETLKTALAERTSALESRIRDLQGELGAARAEVNELLQQHYSLLARHAVDREKMETALAERTSAWKESVLAIGKLQANLAWHEVQSEERAKREAAARTEAAELGRRLNEETAWRDARLVEADTLIEKVRAQREMFVASSLRRLAEIVGFFRIRPLDKELADWQVGPSVAAIPQEKMPMIIRENPYQRANSLEELCAFHGLDFVRCAYVTILGRQPDPRGEVHYMSRLRLGSAKLDIIGQLRKSAEGRAHDPGITGLDRAIRRDRRGRMPVIGWFVRLLTNREGDSPIERKLRSLENYLGQMRHDQLIELSAINALCEQMGQMRHDQLGELSAINALSEQMGQMRHDQLGELSAINALGGQIGSLHRAITTATNSPASPLARSTLSASPSELPTYSPETIRTLKQLLENGGLRA